LYPTSLFLRVFWVSLPAAVYHNFVDLLSANSNKNNNNKKTNNRDGENQKRTNRKAGSATAKKSFSQQKLCQANLNVPKNLQQQQRTAG